MQVNTIIHGDCLEVMPQIPNGSVDMILCDLPYGTTACKWDTIIPFEPLWEQYKRIIKDNGVIGLFGSEPFSSYLRMSNIKMFKYDWIWEKSVSGGFFDAKIRPLKKHEIISVFSLSGASNGTLSSGKQVMRYYPQGLEDCYKKRTKKNVSSFVSKVKNPEGMQIKTNYPNSIIKINNDKSIGHPTQKPVALFEYLIKTYTNENDLVLDNCAGSGTTGVACKNLNRNFILIEKDLGYFNIAQTRIAAIEKQTLLFGTGNLHKHNERLIA